MRWTLRSPQASGVNELAGLAALGSEREGLGVVALRPSRQLGVDRARQRAAAEALERLGLAGAEARLAPDLRRGGRGVQRIVPEGVGVAARRRVHDAHE